MPDHPTVVPLPEVLRRHAATIGDKVAFADATREVTYRELDARAGRLAGHLAGLGLARGQHVAFLLDGCVEVVEVWLAGVRAAAVGIPLNPRATDAELAVLLDDCAPRVLVTDQRHLPQVERVAAARPDVLVLVTGAAPVPLPALPFERLATTEPPVGPRDDLGLDDPAWILYTSGTSGRPKGVVSTQRASLWSTVACYQPVFGLDAEDRLLWPLPMFHALAHSLCVLGVAVTGAFARIVSEPATPATLLRLLDECAITVISGVPTTYHQLLPALAGTRPGGTRLRLCLSGGAPCPAALRDDVERLLGAPLLDGYGSTETSGKIAVERPGGPRVPGACGALVPGNEVRLVDPRTGGPVGPGADGEIWVRGPGVMLRYHGQPEATAQRLVDGWYRTGDLGRFVEHDQLMVTGRTSDLIICGGENIHPREVEEALLGCAGVREAVVVGRPHPVFGEVPVAFVVTGPGDGGAGLDATRLRQACARVLTPMKVPVEFHRIDAVPRTGSGKVLRRPLVDRLGPAPAAVPVDRPSPLVARLAGMTPAQRRSALRELVRAETAAVSDLPGGAPVPLDGPFTDLGISSLGAFTLWSRLGSATGLRLPVTLTFDRPTPADVADYLDGELFGSAIASTVDTRSDRATDGQIAIVAMACRYPGGVRTPEQLWRLVAGGVDATTDFPTDRGWPLGDLYDPDPDRVGATYATRGGFLDGIADFDPAFFGISPREALATDPRQRLLLEVAWEAVERAGVDPLSLRGGDTGVFVGAMHGDYGDRLHGHELEPYLITSSAGSVVSGRLAYVLGLRGPTVTIDTACSSSLVAMHWAARALRDGECSLALAGGVTVMTDPRPFIAFSRQRGLSPDGRCRSYSASADGTGWGEGVGLILLERLDDARRNGHPILATLRGSAVNADGASNGLTAPNGEAQQELIRLALRDAGLSTADVDAVEGHGTATPLGDPIEARALLATYGRGRASDDPVWLGSIKSNIGHTQAAAGVAGVIKMVQAMRHGELPGSRYADDPTPHVDWSTGAVRLLATARPWPPGARPRRAAVSSFGIGGTNAHVIIEESGARTAAKPRPSAGWPTPPWLLSAADEPALRAQARQLADDLEGRPSLAALDIGRSLATSRAGLRRRAALLAGDRDGLVRALHALGRGEYPAEVVRGTAEPGTRLALLFTGQGAQRAGMGSGLAAAFPAFRDAFAEARGHLDPLLPAPLANMVAGTVPGAPLERTDVAQAALFAYQVALFRLLESCGLSPEYLVGHSVGEIAAATVAGVLSLPDAARLVAARGRLMAALPAGGAMVSVQAGAAEVGPLLASMPGRVAIAAVNGPASVVVSGDEPAVAAVAAELAGRGRRTTRLRTSHAFHSPLMDPMLEPFREVVAGLTLRPPAIALVSTLTGGPVGEELTSPEYWVRHARETVRFAEAVRFVAGTGVATVLEVGPAPVLAPLAEECWPREREVSAVASAGPEAPSSEDGASEGTALLAALARLHVRGVPVDWPAAYQGSGAHPVDLPTYAFQRQRYWLDPAPVTPGEPAGHPILGPALSAPDTPEIRYPGRLSTRRQPWLADHQVDGAVLVPATVWVESALRAGADLDHALDELTILVPLSLSGDGAVELQLVVREPDGTGRRPFDGYARPDGTGPHEPWTRHVSGLLRPAGTAPAGPTSGWLPDGARPIDTDAGYQRLAGAGLRYGPAFRAVTGAWRHGPDVYAEVRLPPAGSAEAARYGIHPVLLDAAMHVSALDAPAAPDAPDAAALAGEHEPGDGPRVPFALTGVRLHAPGAATARVRVRPAGASAVSVTVTDLAGRPVAEVASLVTRRLPRESRAASTARRALYRPEWTPVPLPASTGPGDPEYTVLRAVPDDPGYGDDPGHGDGTPIRVRELTATVLAAIQSWLSDPERERTRLVVVTHDATADDPDLAGATVWGLVRSAQAENPGRITLVDSDRDPASPAALAAAVATGAPQLAIRVGAGYVPRLVPVTDDTPGTAIDPAGTVLVTGGTGALGGLLARHLVAEHKVRHLVLAGRRGGAAPGAGRLRAELAGLGATVTMVACDVADPASVRRLVAGCRPPLTAVVHAAGVLDDGVLDALTPDRLARVLAPKVDAAWALHQATQGLDLSAFVLYSSASGLLGRAGQANYAAANSFLDALAAHRTARGLPAVSLAWGPWLATAPDRPAAPDAPSRTGRRGAAPEEPVDGGMASRVTGTARDRLGDEGLRPITAELGAAVFDRGLRAGGPVLVPILLDPGAVRSSAAVPPMLSALLPRPPAAGDGARSDPDAPGSWPGMLAGLPAPEREPALAALLRAELAALLGFPDAASFPADRRLTDLGFDSLASVQLRNRLRLLTGVRLAPTLVTDHPTLAELAAHLHAELTGQLPAPAAPPPGAPPATGLAAVFHRLCQADQAYAASGMRHLASLALPVFGEAERAEHALAPIELAQGGDGPVLLFFPSYAAGIRMVPSRLAAAFAGEARLSLVEYPGFGADPAVPDSHRTLLRVLAETARRTAAGRPLVLIGFCVGGGLAHAVAGQLAADGEAPAGVVLIETHDPREPQRDERLLALIRGGAARPAEEYLALADDARILAGGAYVRLLERWHPDPLDVPALLVRATRPTAHLGALPADLDWRPRWPLPHDTVDVPGDHFTLLTEHADAVAAAIRNWLDGVRSGSSRGLGR